MANSESHTHLVVFSLGRDEYGLPIGRVLEIVRYTEPRPVAAGDPWVCGVIGLRGKEVPVYDIAARLGIPGHPAKIVIIATDAGPAGVAVDDVHEVLTVANDDLRPAPGSSPQFTEALAAIGDRLVAVLDPNAIFTRTDVGAAA